MQNHDLFYSELLNIQIFTFHLCIHLKIHFCLESKHFHVWVFLSISYFKIQSYCHTLKFFSLGSLLSERLRLLVENHSKELLQSSWGSMQRASLGCHARRTPPCVHGVLALGDHSLYIAWYCCSSDPAVPPEHVSAAAAAADESLQSCPTLCDPMDGSPPGFPVPGILQARTLEWVAISFSNA